MRRRERFWGFENGISRHLCQVFLDGSWQMLTELRKPEKSEDSDPFHNPGLIPIDIPVDLSEEEEPEMADTAVFVNRYEKEVPPPTDATTETRLWTGFSIVSILTAAGLMIIRRKREEM